MILEDRGNVKRNINTDSETVLSSLKGNEYIEYRKMWNSSGTESIQSPVPLQLNIELTSYCNLRCKMCYYSYRVNKTREVMSLDLVGEIVKQARDIKIPSIWLGAFSEGLLHQNIKSVLRKFSEIEPLDYWFVTNGTLLTEDIAETMVDIPLTWLSVSLDAASPELYKEIRGGKLDLVRHNILRFLEIRAKKNKQIPFLRVSFVDMEENHHEKQQFMEYWQNIADIVDFQTYSYMGDLSATDLKVSTNFQCTNPFRLISIKYDGELYPCCSGSFHTEDKKYIQDISLLDYWNSKYHSHLLETLRTKNYEGSCIECATRLFL